MAFQARHGGGTVERNGLSTTSGYLVHNERTKLLSSWFNALATALIAAGTFAPLAALLYGLATPGRETIYLIALAAVCLCVGVTLHWIGRATLGRLRE